MKRRKKEVTKKGYKKRPLLTRKEEEECMSLQNWHQCTMVILATVTTYCNKITIDIFFFTDGDETPMSRQEKLLERARRRALSSSLVRELREEYMDAPTELGSNVDGIAAGPGPAAPSREQRERQEYEEAYFTRLPQTKEQRHRTRRLPTLGTLSEELTNFGNDVLALEGGGAGPSSKRKRSSSQRGKKGKKSFGKIL